MFFVYLFRFFSFKKRKIKTPIFRTISYSLPLPIWNRKLNNTPTYSHLLYIVKILSLYFSVYIFCLMP